MKLHKSPSSDTIKEKQGVIVMAARRYELSDAQWEQIKDLIPKAKTGRPPKDDRMMLNAMFWLAVRHGLIFRNATALTRRSTAVFANGGMTEHSCGFFMP